MPSGEDRFSIPKPSTADITSLITGLIDKFITGAPPKQENRGSAFLDIDGITAESSFDGHEDEMEILDFHWHVAQPRSAAASSGAAISTERAHFGDLSVYKAIDLASPQLAQACASGRHFKQATFQLTRAGGDAQPYMTYTLYDVVVTSLRAGGRGYGERIPLEEVSLSYSKIEWDYVPLNISSGEAKGQPHRGSWNLKTNKAELELKR